MDVCVSELVSFYSWYFPGAVRLVWGYGLGYRTRQQLKGADMTKVRWILVNEKDEPVDPENHLASALKDAENLVETLRHKLRHVDCFGRIFIVRQTSQCNGWEWEVLLQDLELPDLFYFVDTVDDCDMEDEAVAAWKASCEHNKLAENPSEDEDPNSPFYGLNDEQKNELMAAIQKQDQLRSTIKGRALPSRSKVVEGGPSKFHENPIYFVQVVENALNQAFFLDEARWGKIHEFYERRYLNPNSPWKEYRRLYGKGGSNDK